MFAPFLSAKMHVHRVKDLIVTVVPDPIAFMIHTEDLLMLRDVVIDYIIKPIAFQPDIIKLFLPRQRAFFLLALWGIAA